MGSTSVPGLDAKPVIDILAGVSDLEAARPCIGLVASLGYLYAPYRAAEMHWFCKPHPSRRRAAARAQAGHSRQGHYGRRARAGDDRAAIPWPSTGHTSIPGNSPGVANAQARPGGAPGARTLNPRIKSPLLCH